MNLPGSISMDLYVKTFEKPFALFIVPPVFDFALYDLYLKPYGLMKIARLLFTAGYRCELLNCLDYKETESIAELGKPRRCTDGTGKFFRQLREIPEGIVKIRRRFARYGILERIVEKRFIEIADRRTPDVIFISTGMTYWYLGLKEIAGLAGRYFPDTPVICGGIYSTLMPGHCAALLELINKAYIVEGNAFPKLNTILSDLGLPSVLLTQSNGSYTKGVIPEKPLLLTEIWGDAGVVRINQGCPYTCEYCASRLICGDFIPGDPEAAFQLVWDMHHICGTSNFAFYDDALLVGADGLLKPFLERTAEECAAGNLPVSFFLPNAVHIDLITEEIATMMFRAGFREIRLGFESASEGFHDKYDEKFAPADFPETVSTLLAAGFPANKIIVYVLAGLPGQHQEEVLGSIRYLQQFGVSISLSEYSPVPGSSFWQESVAKSAYPLEEEPLYHNNSYFPMEWEGFTRRDLNRLKELAQGRG
jgi:radical SAM superfamily enzyme YgiQ (UPF0313 family)